MLVSRLQHLSLRDRGAGASPSCFPQKHVESHAACWQCPVWLVGVLVVSRGGRAVVTVW